MNANKVSEQQLLKEVTLGSTLAYKQLFLTYYSPLCEFASQFIVDQEAEDLVQELMISLWEGRKFLNVTTSVRSYLFTATKNRCLNAIQKNQYVRQKHNLLYETHREQFEDPDFYLADELKELIRKAIDELPDDYRAVFVRSRFGVKTNVQIAAELGVSVKTVEYRITQSLKLLRAKLGDYLMLLLLFGTRGV